MIYFITEGDMRKQYALPSGYDGLAVKIGFTSADSAEGRLKSLQTGNPRQLYVFKEVSGSQSDEGLIHAGLAKQRISGEWFRVRGAFLRHIGRRGCKTADDVLDLIPSAHTYERREAAAGHGIEVIESKITQLRAVAARYHRELDKSVWYAEQTQAVMRQTEADARARVVEAVRREMDLVIAEIEKSRSAQYILDRATLSHIDDNCLAFTAATSKASAVAS